MHHDMMRGRNCVRARNRAVINAMCVGMRDVRCYLPARSALGRIPQCIRRAAVLWPQDAEFRDSFVHSLLWSDPMESAEMRAHPGVHALPSGVGMHNITHGTLAIRRPRVRCPIG